MITLTITITQEPIGMAVALRSPPANDATNQEVACAVDIRDAINDCIQRASDGTAMLINNN